MQLMLFPGKETSLSFSNAVYWTRPSYSALVHIYLQPEKNPSVIELMRISEGTDPKDRFAIIKQKISTAY